MRCWVESVVLFGQKIKIPAYAGIFIRQEINPKKCNFPFLTERIFQEWFIFLFSYFFLGPIKNWVLSVSVVRPKNPGKSEFCIYTILSAGRPLQYKEGKEEL